MRYLLLITDDERQYAAPTPDQVTTMNEGYMKFIHEMGERGVLQGGERLYPTADATTVQVRGDEVLTTDGPFAETKEQMAGYFVVDCADLDEAIEIAAKIPTARTGSVEVRPIWDMSAEMGG
jgi:hypothetical protein